MAIASIATIASLGPETAALAKGVATAQLSIAESALPALSAEGLAAAAGAEFPTLLDATIESLQQMQEVSRFSPAALTDDPEDRTAVVGVDVAARAALLDPGLVDSLVPAEGSLEFLEPVAVEPTLTTLGEATPSAAITESAPLESLAPEVSAEEVGALAEAGETEESPYLPTVEKINGRWPINAGYAGQEVPLADFGGLEDNPVYNEQTIQWSDKGFPDFSPWVHQLEDGKLGDVHIEPTGDRSLDKAQANELMGLERTPEGYCWHHTEERGRMQLLPIELHNAVGHTGGFAMYKPEVATSVAEGPSLGATEKQGEGIEAATDTASPGAMKSLTDWLASMWSGT